MKTLNISLLILTLFLLFSCTSKPVDPPPMLAIQDTVSSVNDQEKPIDSCVVFRGNHAFLCDSDATKRLTRLKDLVALLDTMLDASKKSDLFGTTFYKIGYGLSGKKAGKKYELSVSSYGLISMQAKSDFVFEITEFAKHEGKAFEEHRLVFFYKKPFRQEQSFACMKTGKGEDLHADPKEFETWFEGMVSGIKLAMNDTVGVKV